MTTKNTIVCLYNILWVCIGVECFLHVFDLWNIGCIAMVVAAQFKGAKTMYFFARYPRQTGCTMRWNYFGSGHGKGELEIDFFVILL